MTDTNLVGERRLLTLTRTDVRVVLEHIGEGYSGDYDPADPDDAELVRFTVEQLVAGDWQPVECGSYCTHLLATASPGVLAPAAAAIADAVEEPLRAGEAIKARCEALSWLCVADGELHIPALAL